MAQHNLGELDLRCSIGAVSHAGTKRCFVLAISSVLGGLFAASIVVAIAAGQDKTGDCLQSNCQRSVNGTRL